MKLIIEMEMEMPKRCAECDMVQKTKSGYRCPIASKMHGFSCTAGRGQLERPYYCPIKGVLPEQHGDLIDRNYLLKFFDGINNCIDKEDVLSAKQLRE